MNKTVHYLLVFILTFGLAPKTFSQTPEGINYQAVARDASGELITNKSISVKTIILSGQSASKKVYEETHNVTTNEYGHFNLVVGEGSSSDDFSAIAWNEDPHHLKVEIDLGSGYVVMGTVQLQSVPYALHSKSAETVKNIEIKADDLTDVSTTGAVTGNVLKWNGTSWEPGTDAQGSYTAGSGIEIISSEVKAKTNDALWNANRIQGNAISSTNPKNDEILKWDGSEWTPSEDLSKQYFGTSSVGIKNDSIFANYDNPIWNASKLNNIDVSNGKPIKDQVLQFDGSEWTFATLSSGGGSSALQLWDTTGDNIYFKNNGGNVGINTATPNTTLSVFDSVTSTANIFFIMTDNYCFGGSGTGGRFISNRSILFGQGGGSNMAAMNIATGDISSSGEAIGTYSSASGDGAYNTGAYSTVPAGATSQSIAFFGTTKGESTFNVGLYASADRANSNTNYGVFAIGDSASTNYAGYFIGNVNYTGNLTNVSDAKLKYNVNNLESATDIINKLQPKTYYYKQNGDAGMLNLSEGKQYGFIAQELEEVLPEVVTNQVHMVGPKSDEKMEYKAVNYIALIPVLTQALKEQQETIQRLEKKIEMLETNNR